MRRALLLTLAVAVVTLAAAGSAVGIAYWAMARRFVAGDAHALDGVVRAPVNEPFVLRNVSLWDGRGGQVQRRRSVVVNDGRIAGILDAGRRRTPRSPAPRRSTCCCCNRPDH